MLPNTGVVLLCGSASQKTPENVYRSRCCGIRRNPVPDAAGGEAGHADPAPAWFSAVCMFAVRLLSLLCRESSLGTDAPQTFRCSLCLPRFCTLMCTRHITVQISVPYLGDWF